MINNDMIQETLMITDINSIPIQIKSGFPTQRLDLKITHIEAVILIIQQIIQVIML